MILSFDEEFNSTSNVFQSNSYHQLYNLLLLYNVCASIILKFNCGVSDKNTHLRDRVSFCQYVPESAVDFYAALPTNTDSPQEIQTKHSDYSTFSAFTALSITPTKTNTKFSLDTSNTYLRLQYTVTVHCSFL